MNLKEEFSRSPSDDRPEILLPATVHGRRFSLPRLLGFRNRENNGLLYVDKVGAKRLGYEDATDEMEDKLTRMELEDEGERVKPSKRGKA